MELVPTLATVVGELGWPYSLREQRMVEGKPNGHRTPIDSSKRVGAGLRDLRVFGRAQTRNAD